MIVGIIPLVLIVASCIVIATIVFRKFPQLSVLDVENIPEVKEERKKESFLKKKVERRAEEAKKRRTMQWRPIMEQLRRWQLAFRSYVGRLERRIMHAATREKTAAGGAEEKSGGTAPIRLLLRDARGAMERGDFETAEKKYIGAIRLDPKHKDAYRGLGDVYVEQGHTAEAKETYMFASRLDPSDDAILVALSELAEEEGDTGKAVEYLQRAILLNDNLSSRFARLGDLLTELRQYPTALEAVKQAVDLEPQNPKYLDMLASTAILTGDKALAEEAIQALRMVNPENQRLAVLKDQREKMTP